jgi:hypothetical protein
MANPTTNLNITLPVPGAESSRGEWGGTINDAVQSLDTAIAERGVPSGGTDDQILTKNGTTDYATEWATRLSSVGITGTDGIEVDSGSPVTTSGSITLGINKSTLLTFLNVEDGAAGNMTGAEIKSAYEGESDTNAFTDADHTKLDGIETSATADQTGAEIKSAYEGESDTNALTDALLTKLNGIEASTSLALTLAASGVSAGSYGSSSAIPVITFDAKGRATSASTASFTSASMDDVTALALALG